MASTSAPTVDRDLAIQLTQELVRFPTVNPPGNEEPIARFLAGRMEELGLEAEVQVILPERANVIGRIRGNGVGEGHLVITGHLDVVPVGGQRWDFEPFAGDLMNGLIRGRGSTDMKGGVAAMVTAAAGLAQSGFQPKSDLVLAITAGEEAGMVGAAHMVEHRSLAGSRALVVGEPTGLDVFIAEKGVFWLHVRALGRTAHGSMPSLGVNAVAYMARLLTRLEEYPFPYTESALLGRPTLSPNVIAGGNKTNVVPDFCELTLDMRTVPGQDHAAMLAQLREMAEEVARDYNPEIRVEFEIENEKPPVETDRDDSLVNVTVGAVEAVLGRRPAVGGVAYGTDAAGLSPGFNIPMVICGPGAPQMCHQPNETIEAEQVVQAAEIYAEIAQRMLL